MGKKKKVELSSYAIGGGLFIGMGVGFFFLQESALYFLACMFIGLGMGLVAATLISRKKKQ
ncbi:MAG: hypothetical protein ACMUIE_01275 [Thermoplasmatota archaeon]